jgi:hypothetical protein
MTFIITTLSIVAHNTVKLSVATKPIMLRVVMLSVVPRPIMLNVVMLSVVAPSIHLFFPLSISPVYPSVPSFVYISCLSICSLLCLSLLSIHLFFPLFICPVYPSVRSFVYLSCFSLIPLSITDSAYPSLAPKVAVLFVQQTALRPAEKTCHGHTL